MSKSLTIWCNAHFPDEALDLLKRETNNHKLVFDSSLQKSNLAAGGASPELLSADVALGQPDADQCLTLPNLKWIHLTTAGYTRYDTAEMKKAIESRNGALTNSSSVYDEPCAQHTLAMMLALSRQLPQALIDQRGERSWPILPLRAHSKLLVGQTVAIYGFGAIARRLVEMLAPFKMTIRAARRNPAPFPGVQIVTPEELDKSLGEADHVINCLPSNKSSDGYFKPHHFAAMKPSAIFYNIGRGTTVDQYALRTALETKRIAYAYLDVTIPEPLPPEDPLWHLENCFITPHTAGGHDTEHRRLVQHFLDNLRKYEKGQELRDQVF